MNLTITPETRIGTLLEAYPQFEEVLVRLAPAFAKLRNPILRKTVARVTSLRQAALVGGVDLAELVNTLRQTVGQDSAESFDEDDIPVAGEAPAWFDNDKIMETLDARPMLERGEQPLGIVMRKLNEMPDGDIFELITPFIPVPLLDKAHKKGFDIWYRKEAQDFFRSYFHMKRSEE
jgi:hypothetical protein